MRAAGTKKPHHDERVRLAMWHQQQESNLYLALRRRSFYPLNYAGGAPHCRRLALMTTSAAGSLPKGPVLVLVRCLSRSKS